MYNTRMTPVQEDAFLDRFETREDGACYELATGQQASDEDWRLRFEIQMNHRIRREAMEDARWGRDRRIGGGISWNRSERTTAVSMSPDICIHDRLAKRCAPCVRGPEWVAANGVTP